MKKTYWNIIILTLWTLTLVEQNSYDGSISITRQSQVDSFKINFPEVTIIKGSLGISSAKVVGIHNLDSLELIEKVEGNLSIYSNNDLKSIKGLSRITEIDDFEFTNNDLIDNFNDIPSLKKINGSIKISGNKALKNISFLKQISPEQVTELSIMGCDSLEKIDGVEHFDTLNHLFIVANDKIKNLDGFRNLKHIHSILDISANRDLVDVSGLNQIKTLSTFDFSYNSKITKANFPNLKIIRETLNLMNNPKLTEANVLHNLESIPESRIWLYYNKKLDCCKLNYYCNIKKNDKFEFNITKNYCSTEPDCK